MASGGLRAAYLSASTEADAGYKASNTHSPRHWLYAMLCARAFFLAVFYRVGEASSFAIFGRVRACVNCKCACYALVKTNLKLLSYILLRYYISIFVKILGKSSLIK